MQSLMSATDTLGHQDVRGLSAIDPHRRQWISVTMCKDVGMSLKPVLVTTPHMSVRGDNTTPISNGGVCSSTRANGAVMSLSPCGGGLQAYRPCSVG